MYVQTRRSNTQPQENDEATPQRDKINLKTEGTDERPAKNPSTKALKRRVISIREFENLAKQPQMRTIENIAKLANTERWTPSQLVATPIRVLCDIKHNTSAQIRQQQRHTRLMQLQKEMDLEKEGLCFNKHSQVDRYLQYEEVAKLVSYDLQPQGFCESKNCSVRRDWVKLLRNDLESNPLREEELSSAKSYSSNSLTSSSSSAVAQIQHDVGRTFTSQSNGKHPMPLESHELQYLQRTLQDLLVEYSRIDSEVRYVQGMNLIAGAIINHLREFNLSLRMFHFLMNRHSLRDLFLLQFGQLKDHCDQLFHRHLKGAAPDIYNHLVLQHIQPIMFLPPWLLSLFCCIVPIHCMHLVIDRYVESGFAFLYRLALCYIIFLRDRLLCEREEAIMVLGSSFSRKLQICWPELIAASQRIPLS